MNTTETPRTSRWQLSTQDLAVAGVFGALAAALGGLAGTLTNTIGVLGILLCWEALGTFPVVLLIPIFSMNVPIEIILALVITVPAVAAIRAVARGQIAGART